MLPKLLTQQELYQCVYTVINGCKPHPICLCQSCISSCKFDSCWDSTYS